MRLNDWTLDSQKHWSAFDDVMQILFRHLLRFVVDFLGNWNSFWKIVFRPTQSSINLDLLIWLKKIEFNIFMIDFSWVELVCEHWSIIIVFPYSPSILTKSINNWFIFSTSFRWWTSTTFSTSRCHPSTCRCSCCCSR